MNAEDLSFQILDTLVNAPSSIAGIYADLVYLLGHDRAGILKPLRSTVDALEQRGLVLARVAPSETGGGLKLASATDKERCWDSYVAWLPTARREDLAADEIGLWYGLTESGRAAWQSSNAERKAELWELDEDAAEQAISVVAGNQEAAERRLTEWLQQRRDIVVSSKESRPVAGAKLRSGQTLLTGVCVTYTYVTSRRPPS